jgi:hypothetical protein
MSCKFCVSPEPLSHHYTVSRDGSQHGTFRTLEKFLCVDYLKGPIVEKMTNLNAVRFSFKNDLVALNLFSL